jgi:hypothetical protein
MSAQAFGYRRTAPENQEGLSGRTLTCTRMHSVPSPLPRFV